MLSIALGQNRSVCMFVISMVKFVARQRCLCKLHVRCASQQAPPSFRGRNTSISASPIPIGPAVRTLFAKKAKNEDCANSACAKCHRSIHNRHHHLPEVETHRSVPLPIAIGLAVRTLFAKKAKIKIVPIAIGMCQVPYRSLVNWHSHIPDVEAHQLLSLPIRSDQPFRRYSRKG